MSPAAGRLMKETLACGTMRRPLNAVIDSAQREPAPFFSASDPARSHHSRSPNIPPPFTGALTRFTLVSRSSSPGGGCKLSRTAPSSRCWVERRRRQEALGSPGRRSAATGSVCVLTCLWRAVLRGQVLLLKQMLRGTDLINKAPLHAPALMKTLCYRISGGNRRPS